MLMILNTGIILTQMVIAIIFFVHVYAIIIGQIFIFFIFFIFPGFLFWTIEFGYREIKNTEGDLLTLERSLCEHS